MLGMYKAPEVEKLPLPNPFRQGIWVFLATGTWLGLAPFAPGTVGALWGLPLAWGVGKLSEVWQQIAVMIVLAAVGIPLCTFAARRLGNLKDPGSIVFDEIASLPITFFLVPLDSVWVVLSGFVLHRLFDITKPPPARALERLPSGLGIMADDWIAGLYSNLSLRLLIWSGLFDKV
jgi:phosphatidylglycerophosphatase A